MKIHSPSFEGPRQRDVERAAGPFAPSYARAVQDLRGALEVALRAAGVDPARPQEVARTLGLDKTLAWKAARLVGSADAAAALRFVPGSAGLGKWQGALARRAGGDAITGLSSAVEAFEAMVRQHAGNRATLERLVQGLAHERLEPQTLEQARRSAFQGSSAIWGVQARVQLSISVLAPNDEDPDWVDVAQIGGLLDFCRMRPDVRWLLFSSQSYSLEDGRVRHRDGEPLEPPPGGPEAAPLLADFCSDPLPEVKLVRTPKEERYELPGGPIGNSGLLSCTYAHVARRVGPRHGEDDDAWGEVGAHLLTPAEHLQADVLIHRDLGWIGPPKAQLLSRMDGQAPLGAAQREGRHLPFGERLVDLGRGLAGLSSAEVPRSMELVRHALTRLGWDPEAFRAWRLTMPFPPVPSLVVLASRLPMRPAEPEHRQQQG